MGEIDKAPQDETQLTDASDVAKRRYDCRRAASGRRPADPGSGRQDGPHPGHAGAAQHSRPPDCRGGCTAFRVSARPESPQALADAGIEVIGADLLQPGALDGLPDSPNVIYLVGDEVRRHRRGTALTWMLNTFLPGLVARRFAAARIVALSTGNVYPLRSRLTAAARRSRPRSSRAATTPSRAWGASACSSMDRSTARHAASPLLRLNYANDLRYGVLHDIAQRVAGRRADRPGMGNVNVIWQGDANRVILQVFRHLRQPGARPEPHRTGDACPCAGWPSDSATLSAGRLSFTVWRAAMRLLSNAAECQRLFGYPRVSAAQDDRVDRAVDSSRAGARWPSRPTSRHAMAGI